MKIIKTMRTTNAVTRLLQSAIGAALLAASSPAFALLIDFETTPDGFTPVDNDPFTGFYTDGTTTVTFGYDTNMDRVADESVYYEKYGISEPIRAYNGDGDASGLGGEFFLRLPNSGTGNTHLTPGTQFLITYGGTLPTAASGSIWDIDPPEQFSVTAYNAAGAILEVQTLSPTSANNLPTSFSFSFSGMGEIAFIGATSDTGSPFGFDNFSATTPSATVPDSGAGTVFLFIGALALLGMCGRAGARSIG